MAKPRPVSSALYALLILFCAALPAHAQEGEIVRSIKVQGNQRIGSSTILYYVKTKVGEPLVRNQIRQDIEQIYGLGQFKDIRVETQETLQGLEVVFVVEEIASIGEVEIVGNDELEQSQIKEKIGIKRGITFHRHLVQESIDEIIRLYHDKGFFFAKVKIDAKPKGNLVDVTIQIKEGGKVSIDKIRFTGNKSFKDKELRKVMETRQADWLSLFNDSGIYKKDALKIDLLRVESFYQDHGYLKVLVLEPKIDVDRKKKKIHIIIPVEEGFQYKVGKINIKGDGTFTPEELKGSMNTKEGQIYNMSVIREDILNLTDLYSQKGFAYADISPFTKINDEARTVDLTIQADKGRKVFVGEINVIGNLKTRDNVIRREFRLKEGELFNSEKLKRSRQRINNLGFFSDVKIDTRPGKSPDLIDIDATVAEKPTGAFSIGAGFSSVDNLIFTGSLSQNNLFGRGQTLIFSAQLSSIRTNFNLSFTEPRLFNSTLLAGIDLFNRQTNNFSFEQTDLGAGIRLGKSLGEFNWLGFNYRYDNVEVFNVDPLVANTFLMNGTRITSRVSPTFIRDTRNNFLNPTRGTRHVVKMEMGGLGGTKFFRSGYEVSTFRPLIGKLVLGAHAEINWADGYGGDVLPVFERYFMGGASSLRGFTIRQVGPKDIFGQPVGGKQSLLFNVETIYPITKSFRVFGFYDRGNVYGSGADISSTSKNFSISNMRQSVGGGVRFFSPFGPIGLAYGVKLDKRAGESAAEFHFSAGGAF
ncbi:MAG: outer membrane protein assembly factor BamA [Nitrospinales bacterium]